MKETLEMKRKIKEQRAMDQIKEAKTPRKFYDTFDKFCKDCHLCFELGEPIRKQYCRNAFDGRLANLEEAVSERRRLNNLCIEYHKEVTKLKSLLRRIKESHLGDAIDSAHNISEALKEGTEVLYWDLD